MKKLFVLASLIMLSFASVNAEEGQIQPKDVNSYKAQKHAEMVQRRNAFEEKLGLTEAQKQQAKELRIKSFEKIKPLMEEIKTKKQEISAVRKSRIAVQDQDAKITALEKEIDVLKRKVKKLQQANMKDFEAILTREQKAILKEMKKEGRMRHAAKYSKK